MKTTLQLTCCMIVMLCATATVFSQAPGKLKWAFKTGDQIWSSPAISADGTIYIGSLDNMLYAINPNGTEKWAFTTGDNAGQSPAIGADGTIYFGHKKLYAITPDGTRKWVFATGDWGFSSPAIGADGSVYVGSQDGKLYALNPNGTQKWAFTTGDEVNSSPAIGADGIIYVSSRDGQLYAVNPNGTQKWVSKTGSSSPAIGADGTVYAVGVTVLYAINWDGTQKWLFRIGDWFSSGPAIGANGTVYVGSQDGKLYAINPNGTQKWAFTTGDNIGSSPTIGADGTIYVGSQDKKLYAINPDGTQKWFFKAGDFVFSSPAIGVDGTVYFGSRDKKLYALHSSENGLAVSPWPKFKGDNRNSGRVYLPPKPNDVGVASIQVPVTVDLDSSLSVSVGIRNFGTAAQSNFAVSYQVNAEVPVTENFFGTLQPGADTVFTFATPCQLPSLGIYTIKTSTELAGDERPENDVRAKTIQVTDDARIKTIDVVNIEHPFLSSDPVERRMLIDSQHTVYDSALQVTYTILFHSEMREEGLIRILCDQVEFEMDLWHWGTLHNKKGLALFREGVEPFLFAFSYPHTYLSKSDIDQGDVAYCQETANKIVDAFRRGRLPYYKDITPLMRMLEVMTFEIKGTFEVDTNYPWYSFRSPFRRQTIKVCRDPKLFFVFEDDGAGVLVQGMFIDGATQFKHSDGSFLPEKTGGNLGEALRIFKKDEADKAAALIGVVGAFYDVNKVLRSKSPK